MIGTINGLGWSTKYGEMEGRLLAARPETFGVGIVFDFRPIMPGTRGYKARLGAAG